MREIVITITDNRIINSDDFAGYQGEHNATLLKFELPAELKQNGYTYKTNITLPDSITATTTLKDMQLSLTNTLTANAGVIQLQLVVVEGNNLIYKSGVTKLTIKTSLAPTAIIDGVNNTGIQSAIVNSDGNLIITLTDGKEIDAGYVKGDKGNTGDTYTLTDTDKQEIANMVLELIPNGDEVSY